MKTTLKLLLVCLMVSASAIAQIGQDKAGCDKAWGVSPSGKLDDGGNGSLRYESRGTSVELVFSNGFARKAIYRKPGLSEQDVDSLLRLNNNEVEWAKWTPSGIPPEGGMASMWLRSDEQAMAEFKDGQLLIVGSDGNPSHPAIRAAEVEAETNATEGAPVGSSGPAVTLPKTAIREKPPKVDLPAEMPSLGDSRADVLSLLGAPSGTMDSGGKQILVYAWGSVWVEQDKVVKID